MRQSGHSSGTGVVKDYEKLCLAAANGWRVFLLADSMINDEYLAMIASAIADRPQPTTAKFELN